MIKWTQHFAVGVDILDRQHRELFRRMNRLAEQLDMDASKAPVADALRFLLVYVEVHVNEEEQFMKLHKYPRLEQHRRAHAGFLRRLEQLIAEPRESYSREEIRSLLADWIANHIRRADMDFGHYLETQALLQA